MSPRSLFDRAALGRYWRARPMVAEGRAWVAESLDYADTLEPETAARLVRAGSHLAALAGDYPEQLRLAEDALGRWEALGDDAAIAGALGDVALASVYAGDLDRAVEYYERSREAARAAGDEPVLALVSLNLADLELTRGEHERGREIATEAAALGRRLKKEGVERKLVSLGARHGDEVVIHEKVFEFLPDEAPEAEEG
jgi:tetratricopeptide (TPR) repeat protein